MTDPELNKVQEAVTFAAQLLSTLKRAKGLDERDRKACQLTQEKLEEAEAILYGTDLLDSKRWF